MSADPDTLRTYAAIFEKRIARDDNPLFPHAAPPGCYREPNAIDVAAAKALRFLADAIEAEAKAENCVLEMGRKSDV